ncbi:transcription repressor OFP7 [Carica papaya]|uniref:transcription repressor OFP7 n=1 Tax=Carica papaya TaxID=3649 RepID=UPI000B8C9FC9|nr:transcription repressor OFP7 [Carica papaya]
MAKRFKLNIARVFSKSFRSCRSKDPSSLPANPVPSFLRLSPISTNTTLQPAPPTPHSIKPHRSSLKRHVSSALTSIGCGLRSRSSTQCPSETDHSESPPPPTPQFHWEKHDKWHVIANCYDEAQTPRRKVYSSLISDDDVSRPLPPPPPSAEKKKRRSTKKKTAAKTRISTSSADSVLFSSETLDDMDDEETETLVSSSRGFSTDSSSEFNVGIGRSKKSKRSKGKGPKRCCGMKGKRRSWTSAISSSSPEKESPARLSMFLQRMIACTVEGKVRESFAVVKRSEEPYEDFKRSMMEMVLEKEMFEGKDLEQLLQCFLSLNSRQHHAAIVRAFSDIWEALFCNSSTVTAMGRRSSSSSSSVHGVSSYKPLCNIQSF